MWLLGRAALLWLGVMAHEELTPNVAYSAHAPDTRKCRIATSVAPNFCPPIPAQSPAKDKGVCYFWLTTPAQGTLVFPRALRGQTLPVIASEQ